MMFVLHGRYPKHRRHDKRGEILLFRVSLLVCQFYKRKFDNCIRRNIFGKHMNFENGIDKG